MTFEESTGRTIDEAFTEFHKKNPVVYEYFCRYVQQILDKGKKLTSSKMILNRIRWEIYIELNSEEEFRINDAFTSRYSRLYVTDHPDKSELFKFRELRGQYSTFEPKVIIEEE